MREIIALQTDISTFGSSARGCFPAIIPRFRFGAMIATTHMHSVEAQNEKSAAETISGFERVPAHDSGSSRRLPGQ
jgi:hypothetical protein